MCTVTWLQQGERCRLLCNRDELRTRKAALSPIEHRRHGVAYLAPVDGEAGGSWLTVNEYGLVLCLVNDYRSPMRERPDGYTSRGCLVTGMAAVADLDALADRWREIEVETYRPFQMLAVAPGRAPRLLGWNGAAASVQSSRIEQPLSSSSYDDEGAAAIRRELLREFAAKGDPPPENRLFEFHRSHLPERGPFSVCMHRSDASTVSFTLIDVSPDTVTMTYAAGPPCTTPLAPPITLRRRTVGL